MWRLDGDACLRALAMPLMPQGPIPALAIGPFDGDSQTDPVLSSMGSDDRVHVYEVVGGPIIPAVSSWGMVVMVLLVCAVGTVVLHQGQSARGMVG